VRSVRRDENLCLRVCVYVCLCAHRDPVDKEMCLQRGIALLTGVLNIRDQFTF
jgi:hypothetical protein